MPAKKIAHSTTATLLRTASYDRTRTERQDFDVLVYGDHAWFEDSRDILSRIEAELRTAEQLEPGIERHAKLVNAWLKGGELMQGIADA